MAQVSLARSLNEEYVAPAPATLGIADLEPDAVGIVAHLLQQQAVAFPLTVIGWRRERRKPAVRLKQGRARSGVVLDKSEHRAIGRNAKQLAPIRRCADKRFAAVADRNAHDLSAPECKNGEAIRRRHGPREIDGAADAPSLTIANVDPP